MTAAAWELGTNMVNVFVCRRIVHKVMAWSH
ncbi:hypothetical protein QFZ35_003165 [Arthrobacter ulcerisalmonis]|nr:hypothetical protein [Arthrobacter ulcerisalmonis]